MGTYGTFCFCCCYDYYFRLFSGGGKRDRTADLLHAMQALSQLSYTPTRDRALYRRPPGV